MNKKELKKIITILQQIKDLRDKLEYFDEKSLDDAVFLFEALSEEEER